MAALRVILYMVLLGCVAVRERLVAGRRRG
jgi:hypothetical protein